MNRFERTEKLFGKNAIAKLACSKVIVFGLGGVGGYVVEALARGGIGTIDIVDNDKISITNINRQIYALESTLNQYKTEVAKKRILDINPNIKVEPYNIFYNSETSYMFDFSKYDYVIDAIDSTKSKIEIIKNANNAQIPVISSMGTGNKTDYTKLEISDIYSTSTCPLARIIRHELKKEGIKKLKVLYSKEPPKTQEDRIISSCSYLPPIAGLMIASEVILDIIKSDN